MVFLWKCIFHNFGVDSLVWPKAFREISFAIYLPLGRGYLYLRTKFRKSLMTLLSESTLSFTIRTLLATSYWVLWLDGERPMNLRSLLSPHTEVNIFFATFTFLSFVLVLTHFSYLAVSRVSSQRSTRERAASPREYREGGRH